MDFMRWVKYQWDRVAALVLFIAGLLALLLGWVGASGSVYPAEQLPYMISGGILGIFFLGTAGILYVSADMRDEWRKLDGIEDALRRIAPPEPTGAPVLADSAPADLPTDVETTLPGTRARTSSTGRRRTTRTAPASRS
ncbi:MAG TPA: hypothetical protein VHE83_11755 [Mycobacteriales bacterium]|nr:hypothetical protein [Mycobacteriales bacterium]